MREGGVKGKQRDQSGQIGKMLARERTAGQELHHSQMASAMDAPECDHNAASKINYPV